jgi:hypothetical protein
MLPETAPRSFATPEEILPSIASGFGTEKVL